MAVMQAQSLSPWFEQSALELQVSVKTTGLDFEIFEIN